MMSIEKIQQYKPKTMATLIEWKKIYRDKLLGFSTLDLAIKYERTRNSIRSIIRWTLAYIDNDFEQNEETVLAKHKAQKRVIFLRGQVDILEKSPYVSQLEKSKLILSYEKEIRINNELVHKLDGVLKPDVAKYIDQRKIIIKHNIGNTTNKQVINKVESDIKPLTDDKIKLLNNSIDENTREAKYEEYKNPEPHKTVVTSLENEKKVTVISEDDDEFSEAEVN